MFFIEVCKNHAELCGKVDLTTGLAVEGVRTPRNRLEWTIWKVGHEVWYWGQVVLRFLGYLPGYVFVVPDILAIYYITWRKRHATQR